MSDSLTGLRVETELEGDHETGVTDCFTHD